MRPLGRRAFVRSMVGLGVGVPLAHQMPGAAPRARAAGRDSGWIPARRGGGGPLRALWWQAATLLNPHLSLGLKDADGARLCYEPLAAFDTDGAMVPVLARDIPNVDDGTVARDGMSVTWRLKTNVVWQDGRPFTADDVVFTWEY